MKRCAECGAMFYPKYASSKLCFDCWKKREDAFHLVSELEAQIKFLNRKISVMSSSPSIPEDQLKRLIYLCHPDKHGQSESALNATKFLLQIKRGSR